MKSKLCSIHLIWPMSCALSPQIFRFSFPHVLNCSSASRLPSSSSLELRYYNGDRGETIGLSYTLWDRSFYVRCPLGEGSFRDWLARSKDECWRRSHHLNYSSIHTLTYNVCATYPLTYPLISRHRNYWDYQSTSPLVLRPKMKLLVVKIFLVNKSVLVMRWIVTLVLCLNCFWELLDFLENSLIWPLPCFERHLIPLNRWVWSKVTYRT